MSKKVYLFAGASSAIAHETAKQLQSEGHVVIGLSTKQLVNGYDDFFEVQDYTTSSFPKIENSLDGVVYFPGTINLKPFHRLTADDFINDFNINTLGAVAFAQAYLPNLKMAESSSIVFVSSVAVQTGLTFHSSIAMAKGALEGLTRALAAELAPKIRVNCVAPSLVNTPLGEKFINTPEKIEQMQKRNPLQKIGQPEDVASAITYLLSSKSKWVTGQVLHIDGGMSTLKI
jgi:3-oxoacyl-[acyl-carrier protein] reductase